MLQNLVLLMGELLSPVLQGNCCRGNVLRVRVDLGDAAGHLSLLIVQPLLGSGHHRVLTQSPRFASIMSLVARIG